MIENPKISVVTVVFNGVTDIEKTICSVINQTYKNIEYIIIDGGSTDGTIDIIKKYEKSISYFISEKDNGIYDAMNKGIKRATGRWVNFMNAGDLFDSSTVLQELSEAFTPGIRILRGNIIRIYPKFKAKSVGVTSQNPTLLDMFNNTFHHQACLIETSLFNDFGFYSIDYKLCSDWKFFFDCIIFHKVKSKYINLTIAHFKMNGASSNNSILYLQEQEKYLKSIYGEELFNILHELNIYRKSKIIKLYYKLRCYMIEHLSQKNFNRILVIKRFLRNFFNLDVN